MAKYKVIFEETIHYEVEVDVADEEEAADAAEELFVQSSNPFGEFNGSVDERDVIRIDLV